jgi:hypothetical protein
VFILIIYYIPPPQKGKVWVSGFLIRRCLIIFVQILRMKKREKYYWKTFGQCAVLGTIAWVVLFGYTDPFPWFIDVPYYVGMFYAAVVGLDWFRGYIPAKEP